MDNTIEYKRTPELDDYLAQQALAVASLGNVLLEELPQQFYDLQEEKKLNVKDIRFIISRVVLQYDEQFGINAFGKDPVIAKKMAEKLKAMEELGLVKVIEEEAHDNA